MGLHPALAFVVPSKLRRAAHGVTTARRCSVCAARTRCACRRAETTPGDHADSKCCGVQGDRGAGAVLRAIGRRRCRWDAGGGRGGGRGGSAGAAGGGSDSGRRRGSPNPSLRALALGHIFRFTHTIRVFKNTTSSIPHRSQLTVALVLAPDVRRLRAQDMLVPKNATDTLEAHGAVIAHRLIAVALAPGHFDGFAHSRRPQDRHGPPRGARRRQQEPPCLRLRASSRCADRVQRRHVYHDTPSVGVNVARGRNSTTTHRHRNARASSRCNWHSRDLVQRRCEARDGVDGLQSRIALSSGSARPPTRSSSPVVPREADAVVTMALGESPSCAPPSAPHLRTSSPVVPREADTVVHFALAEPFDTTVDPATRRRPLPAHPSSSSRRRRPGPGARGAARRRLPPVLFSAWAPPRRRYRSRPTTWIWHTRALAATVARSALRPRSSSLPVRAGSHCRAHSA
ncbi:hypothetical protein DFH09DRAFT_652633 [Mycena vulgaris]|nr:hypothetical protein DFH09DRAFT_652633 [Mycena vulgaris]